MEENLGEFGVLKDILKRTQKAINIKKEINCVKT